jgi:transposase
MFKKTSPKSNPPRRVRGAGSGASRHADAAALPRSIASGCSDTVAKPGPARSRVLQLEQPTETTPRASISHGQERVNVTAASSTTAPLKTPPVFVGIDVAKAKFDLGTSLDPRVTTFDHTDAGVRQAVTQLVSLKPALVVLEATGGLERKLAAALLDAALPVAVVNPRHVRHFAIGLRISAKTDPIDTRVLVRYAELAHPRLLEKRPANQAELAALVVRRRQLVTTRAEETNRLQQVESKVAKQSIRTMLATLDKQVDRLDKAIASLIESDDDLSGKNQIIQSVPGVGPVVAATLLAEVPELGDISQKQLSALIGVAPYNHDSGKFKGTRSIFGGRASVRCVLYMAAVTATTFNPTIKAFAERLKARGRVAKVALVACMRKLLTIINALVKRNESWNPQKLQLAA